MEGVVKRKPKGGPGLKAHQLAKARTAPANAARPRVSGEEEGGARAVRGFAVQRQGDKRVWAMGDKAGTDLHGSGDGIALPGPSSCASLVPESTAAPGP